MPVLDALPHLTIIRGLKGILDFYYWKGIPCVRKWPVIPPSSRSPRSLESARIFGAIVAAYSLLGAVLKELFALNAADQPRTARDLFVSAVLGHLHDHNMSDFLDLLTEATAYLATLKDLANALNAVGTDELRVKPGYDGANYFPLLIDAARHIQADIITSALPATAADDTRQDTMITALELIDNLVGALESVHTDRLKVRGESQLHAYQGTLAKTHTGAISGANGYIDSNPADTDTVFIVTSVAVRDNTNPVTAVQMLLRHVAINYRFHNELVALAANTWYTLQCEKWMAPNDVIRIYLPGAQAGDTCVVNITGHYMTLET